MQGKRNIIQIQNFLYLFFGFRVEVLVFIFGLIIKVLFIKSNGFFKVSFVVNKMLR